MDRGRVIKSQSGRGELSVSNRHEMMLNLMTLRSSSMIAACAVAAASVLRTSKTSTQLFEYVRVKSALGEVKEGGVEGRTHAQSKPCVEPSGPHESAQLSTGMSPDLRRWPILYRGTRRRGDGEGNMVAMWC